MNFFQKLTNRQSIMLPVMAIKWLASMYVMLLLVSAFRRELCSNMKKSRFAKPKNSCFKKKSRYFRRRLVVPGGAQELRLEEEILVEMGAARPGGLSGGSGAEPSPVQYPALQCQHFF